MHQPMSVSNDKDIITYRHLLHAVTTGSAEEVETILQQESSFKGGNRCKTLFTKAVETNNRDVILCLLRHEVVPDEESPIFCAISKNDALELLLDENYDLDVTSSTGKRPLHVAISVNPDAVPLLLKAGCDVTARDSVHGNTPLHVACGQVKIEAVLGLIQAGAWLNAENDRGETPLYALLKNACSAHQNFHSKSRQNLARRLVNLGMRLTSHGRRVGRADHKVLQVYQHSLRTSRHLSTLQHLCRLAVRGHCEVKAIARGQDLVKVLKELYIPLYLRDYLMYRPNVFDRTI